MKNLFTRSFAVLNLFVSQAVMATSTLTLANDTSGLVALAAGMNISTLGVPTPPLELDLRYELGGPKLRQTSCLMNALAALKELALGDWVDKVIDGTEFRLERYPDVGISVATPRVKRNIQARFVIWAICLGVTNMIDVKKFEFEQVQIRWNQQLLGWVQIGNYASGPGLTMEESQANRTLDSASLSATFLSANRTPEIAPINITNMVTTDSANDPAEARLNVTFTPFGQHLAIYDIFVVLMSALSDMATFPSTHQTTAFIAGLSGWDGILCILPVEPPRTSRPFMEFGWLVRAVNRIPAYMLETGRFGEVEIWIEVDHVKVAFGRLCLKPDNCRPEALLPVSLKAAES